MAEKITLKNALANLPQKTDVDSIVARDASGNPVYIKKADLAQVSGGTHRHGNNRKGRASECKRLQRLFAEKDF